MDAIKNFFQVDIPAAFSAGKLRIALIQLNSQLGQIENQKDPILNDLGAKAWEGRVKDTRYGITYDKLEELDASAGQVQQEIDDTQNSLLQETDRLNTITSDFNSRSKEIQDQRQPAAQRLNDLQAQQKGIENRLNQIQTMTTQGAANVQHMEIQANQLQSSAQPDKDAKIASLQSTIATVKSKIDTANVEASAARGELESNQAAQKPIEDQIAGYDQLTKMLQEQYRSAAAPIQSKIKDLQQSLAKLKEKKTGFNQKLLALMPDLGKEVYKYRPSADLLSTVYSKLDAIDSEIKTVNDQINLTNARLASVGSRSVQKVVIAGGALVLLLACFVAVVIMVPTIAGVFKADPKASIHLVQSWSLENCAPAGVPGNYLDISIWQNRRSDSTAFVGIDTKLIGSNQIVLNTASDQFDIGPGGLAVSFANLDPQGSRVQTIQRTVSSVTYKKFTLGQLPNIGVKTYFEKVQYSNNITLGLEITNNSDFGVSSGNGSSYALVINAQNKIIDILVGALANQSIAIDSMSTISFQSVGNYYLNGTCLQSDYSQEPVTFWYFVPLQITTSSSDQISVNGKVHYTP